MKLQKQKAYKLDDGRWQFKYVVTIQENLVEELGWSEGVELSENAESDSLVLSKAPAKIQKKRREIATKMPYPEFREKIEKVLKYSDGMTWTQIRSELKLDQVVPNNRWVKQLENDIALRRVKVADNKVLWRLNHVRT